MEITILKYDIIFYDERTENLHYTNSQRATGERPAGARPASLKKLAGRAHVAPAGSKAGSSEVRDEPAG